MLGNLDRRGFLKLFGGAAAAAVAAPLIPFNRLWSFPTNIVIPEVGELIFGGMDFVWDGYEREFAQSFKIGTPIRVRLPQRFIVRDYIGDFSQPEKYKTVTLLKPGDRFSIDSVNIVEKD
jgi:hypothetical protein